MADENQGDTQGILLIGAAGAVAAFVLPELLGRGSTPPPSDGPPGNGDGPPDDGDGGSNGDPGPGPDPGHSCGNATLETSRPANSTFQLRLTHPTKDVTQVRFKIFNLGGELVRDSGWVNGDSWIWDGANQNGNRVAAGTYAIRYWHREAAAPQTDCSGGPVQRAIVP